MPSPSRSALSRPSAATTSAARAWVPSESADERRLGARRHPLHPRPGAELGPGEIGEPRHHLAAQQPVRQVPAEDLGADLARLEVGGLADHPLGAAGVGDAHHPERRRLRRQPLPEAGAARGAPPPAAGRRCCADPSLPPRPRPPAAPDRRRGRRSPRVAKAAAAVSPATPPPATSTSTWTPLHRRSLVQARSARKPARSSVW